MSIAGPVELKDRQTDRHGIISMIRWFCAMILLFVIIEHDGRRQGFLMH